MEKSKRERLISIKIIPFLFVSKLLMLSILECPMLIMKLKLRKQKKFKHNNRITCKHSYCESNNNQEISRQIIKLCNAFCF